MRMGKNFLKNTILILFILTIIFTFIMKFIKDSSFLPLQDFQNICEKDPGSILSTHEYFGSEVPVFIVNEETTQIDVSQFSQSYLANHPLETYFPKDVQWESEHNQNYGYTDRELWIRFLLKVQANPNEFFFKIDFPSLDQIEFFFIDPGNGKCIDYFATGDTFSQKKRPIDSHIFYLPFSEIEALKKVSEILVYVKVFTTASLIFPLKILNFKEVYRDETGFYLAFGLYFGFLLSIFTYNFILYFFTREKLFIAYLLFLGTHCMLVFSSYGFGNRFLYPDSLYLTNNSFLTLASLATIASLLFSVDFLKIDRFFPYSFKILFLLMLSIFVLTVGFQISGKQVFYKILLPQLAILPLIVFVLSILLAKRYIYARYFVVGRFIFILFSVVSVLRLLGLISNNPISYYGIQIGSCIEMLILSIAVAHRLYDYKKKSDKFQVELLAQKSKQAEELKRLVGIKTEELRKSVVSIQSDIEIAKRIQLSTLPNNVDWKENGLDAAIFFFPKEFLSGDIYDLCQLDESRYRIFLADATGHGIQAGFFTMSIRTEYERIKYEYSDTSQILRLLNQSVFKTFSNMIMLYTCFIIDIDISQKFFQYSSAGHPAQLLYQNGEFIELSSLNPIVGYRNDIEIRSRSIPIHFPFQLLLFTDGITEMRNSENMEYGVSNLKGFIQTCDNKNAENFLFDIFEDCNFYVNNSEFEDDITMIYVKGFSKGV